MAIRTSSQTEKVSSPGLTIRQRWIGILRIVFGLIWAVAASLKWRSEFINNFAALLKGSMDGQPQLVNHWIAFWANIVQINPTLFAYALATIETVLAVCFILGVFTNMACVAGILLSFCIWAIPEGFGGPYCIFT